MRSDNYKEYFVFPYLKGPNGVRLLDELLESYPCIDRNSRVLDLGCGSGITSMFVAKETGAAVFANDIWISAEDYLRRFEEWGLAGKVIPVHERATELQFDKETFDAIVSVDSYQYFGTEPGFFSAKILPMLKHGGTALICVPGVKSTFTDRSDAPLRTWLGEERYLFRTADEWKQLIGRSLDIAEMKVWEMFGFYKPWEEWFATGHEFALRDKMMFDSIIRPVTCFVGIMVKKR